MALPEEAPPSSSPPPSKVTKHRLLAVIAVLTVILGVIVGVAVIIALVASATTNTLKILPGENATFLLSEPEIVSAHYIEITPGDIQRADFIKFPFGGIYKFVDQPNSDGDYHGYNFAGSRAGDEADVTVNAGGDDIAGFVTTADGDAYEITYVGGNATSTKHLWIKRKREGSAPTEVDFVEGEEGETNEESRRLLALGRDDGDSMTDLSITIYFTREFEDNVGSVAATVENLITESNRKFSRSGVRIRLFLHCLQRYDGEEPEERNRMIKDFHNSKGTNKALLGGADFACLLFQNPNVLGHGAQGSTVTPFCSINHQQMDEYFIHELGHILGAHHDLATLEGRTQPAGAGTALANYGVGYWPPGTDKRTIMAYWWPPHLVGNQHFSSRSVRDRDGDVTGWEFADNARLMNERRFLYQNIGDERQKCPGISGDDGTGPTPVSCHDKHRFCPSWARNGECVRNSAYMASNCAESCGRCDVDGSALCDDWNAFCADWARRGECARNEAYMSQSCRKSCRLC